MDKLKIWSPLRDREIGLIPNLEINDENYNLTKKDAASNGRVNKRLDGGIGGGGSNRTGPTENITKANVLK